ncbi:MAG: fibronectin type III domain-containing protein [Caldilineaceae bacterium]|nr:fibronectin type III domain-containing protein [Caldilineaceae bacterium]
MELMTYKTRAVRTLSLLILVALLAALNPPSITGGVALGQGATVPVLTANADTANQVDISWTEVTGATEYSLWRWEDSERWVAIDRSIEGTTYTDNTVVAGRTYTYQVSADGETTWSDRQQGRSTVTVGAYDASTLNEPTASSTMIGLSWSEVTGAASYELWRFENSWTQVGGTITGTSYSDTAVGIGRTYYYQVMAKGPNGDGAWSNRVSATVPSTTPGAPINFSATPSDAQVTLSWDAPTSDGGSAITGYEYRYQQSGGSWSNWMATSPALSRTATVGSLTNESAHNFEVRAMNANGDGLVASATATPMSTVPGVPQNLRATTAGPTSIQLNWDASAGAASYSIQRRMNGGAWVDLSGVSGTSHTDSDLTPSTAYDYQILATNTAGSSAWSAVVTQSTADPTAPAATNVRATAGANNILLEWDVPDDGGAAITGYKVQVSGDGSTWSDLATLGASQTSYDHTGLTPGTMNYYRVQAMNSIGDSAWSQTRSARVAAVAPGAPSLIASPDGQNAIMLTWSAPADDGGAAITGYTLQVSSDGTTGWSTRTSPSASATEYSHTGLQPGTTRYYRISARNSAGSGDWSATQSATTAGAAPPDDDAPDTKSPQQLRAETAQNSADNRKADVMLHWNAPSSTNIDINTNNSKSYEIEKWNGATQAWNLVGYVADGATADAANMILADSDGDTGEITVTDSALAGGKDFIYRVRSIEADTTANTDADNPRSKWARVTQKSAKVAPGKPTLTATAAAGKITLRWTLSDDGGSPIARYELQVSTDSGGTWTSLAGEADPVHTVLEAVVHEHTHMDLPGGVRRDYRIRAANDAVGDGNVVDPDASPAIDQIAASERGLHSDPVFATTPKSSAAAPANLAAAGGDGQITLSWTAVANENSGAPLRTISGYEVEVWDDANEEWDALTFVDGQATAEYIHTGLSGNTTKYYRVRAKDSDNGVGKWSNVADGTTNDGVPGKPMNVMAEAHGSGEIRLTWMAPANDGGTAVSRYQIALSGEPIELTAGAVTTTELPDTGDLVAATVYHVDIGGEHDAFSRLSYTDMRDLAGNATRYYRIRAANGAADTDFGAWSDQASTTTATTGVPGKPTLTLTVEGSDKINLNIVAPTDDGGSPITGYRIYVWDGSWSTLADVPATVTGDGTAGDTDYEYQHAGLSGSTTRYYSARAKNVNGFGADADVVSATTDPGKPGKPMLTATASGSDKVVLTWDVVEGADAYGIQFSRTGTTGWVELVDDEVDTTDSTIVMVPMLSYEHKGRSGATRYYYRVRALKEQGTDDPHVYSEANEVGDWSDVKNAMTDAGKPAKPELTVTADGSSKIRLTWTVSSDGGSRITGYEIEVWDSASGNWMDLATAAGSASSYTHENLPGYTMKYYRVRAMNSVDYSAWSDSMSDRTAAGKPGAPMLTAKADGTSMIRLTWTKPQSGGPDTVMIESYELQVSDDGSTGWTATTNVQSLRRIVGGETVHCFDDNTDAACGTDEVLEQNFTHGGHAPGTMKYYRIRALNSETVSNDARGPWSDVVSATTVAGAPGKPDLNATASGTSMISLTWTAPKSDGGSAITGYELQYWDGSNGWMDLTSPAAGDTTYTHRNIPAGTTKYYRIRARNAGGPGAWSTITNAMTSAARPDAPTLTATAMGSDKIKVSWTLGHDGGSPVTGYLLQYSKDAGRSWMDLLSPTPTMMEHTHTGLAGGETRHYRISATNAKGSTWSTVASATTDRSVPGKPTLDPAAGNKRVALDWSDPATPTGGSPILRYEVQIWDSEMRRWKALISTGATNYTHYGLTNGTRYFYRVRAVNAQGDGPWSTFVSATPN